MYKPPPPIPTTQPTIPPAVIAAKKNPPTAPPEAVEASKYVRPPQNRAVMAGQPAPPSPQFNKPKIIRLPQFIPQIKPLKLIEKKHCDNINKMWLSNPANINLSPFNIKSRFPCQGITIHKRYKLIKTAPTPDAPQYKNWTYISGYRIKNHPGVNHFTFKSRMNNNKYTCLIPNLFTTVIE